MSNILLIRLRSFCAIAQNDLFILTSSMLQEADLCPVTVWQEYLIVALAKNHRKTTKEV